MNHDTDLPPLPKDPPAIFHHPSLLCDLFDRLTLHKFAVGYALDVCRDRDSSIVQLRGEKQVLADLLKQCDQVLATLDSESTDEAALTAGLRGAIKAALTPDSAKEPDLLRAQGALS